MIKFKKTSLILMSTVFVSPIVLSSCGHKVDTKNNDSHNYKLLKNTSSYIDDDVLELLDKRISYLSNGVITQNILKELKSINIVDTKNSENEGEYYERSNEIFINTNIMKKHSIKRVEDKAEYLYELIYHELIHFVNDVFLNNIPPSSKFYSKQIFQNLNNNRVNENWNDNFVDEFKKELKYDKDTKLYSSSKIKSNYVSLGSVYNQKSLFDIANQKDIPDFKKLSGNEVMSPINPDPNLPIDDEHIIKSSSLEYLYSMQELVARKLQVISMEYKPNIKNNIGFDKDGWIHTDTSNKIWSPYLQDVVNFKRGLNSSSGVYIQDVPTQNLLNLYKEYINSNSIISFIDFKNNITLDKNKDYTGAIDRSTIMFGGFLPNNNKKHIGYMKNNIYIDVPINIKRSKTGYEYVTQNFVDVNKIKDKELFISTNSNGLDRTALSNFNIPDKNIISTYKNWFKDEKGNYTVTKNYGKLMITSL